MTKISSDMNKDFFNVRAVGVPKYKKVNEHPSMTQPTLFNMLDDAIPRKATELAPGLTPDKVQKLRLLSQRRDWRALKCFAENLEKKVEQDWKLFVAEKEASYARGVMYRSANLTERQCALLERLYQLPLRTIRILVGKDALIDLHSCHPACSIRDYDPTHPENTTRFLVCVDNKNQLTNRLPAVAGYEYNINNWPTD